MVSHYVLLAFFCSIPKICSNYFYSVITCKTYIFIKNFEHTCHSTTMKKSECSMKQRNQVIAQRMKSKCLTIKSRSFQSMPGASSSYRKLALFHNLILSHFSYYFQVATFSLNQACLPYCSTAPPIHLLLFNDITSLQVLKS